MKGAALKRLLIELEGELTLRFPLIKSRSALRNLGLRTRPRILLARGILALILAGPAAAQTPPPNTKKGDYSPYEQETIRSTLKLLRSELDPEPEGKTIEDIEVLTLDVIEPRDPAPAFLNIFHATTRNYIVERELLFRRNERYLQTLVDETARNLRSLSQVSLVVCIPLRGKTANHVRVAVVTKDVWSLRLNSQFSFTSAGVENLLLQPTENNLLGTHQAIAGRLQILPLTDSLGLKYTVRRIGNSRVSFTADANVIVNRDSSKPEGSFGSLLVSQPLFSTLTDWSWGASATWRNDIVRRYVNAKLGTYDSKETPEDDKIPFEYRSVQLTSSVGGTRSFGWAVKHDFSAGFEISDRLFRSFDLSRYNATATKDFLGTKVPRNDTRLGPFFQYHGYTTNFLRVLDFETLGLQEDYRLGHDIYLRFYPVLAPLGSSRTFAGIYGGTQYTFPFGDGFARASLESTTEVESESLPDGSLESNLRIVTPRLGIGRLVWDWRIVNRYRNSLNRTFFLGGDGRLRGYPTNYLVGKDILAYNLEFRTRALQIFSCQLGAAAFYDAGDVFDGFDAMRMKHSVGFGIRALFPQLDRVVFRGDVGFPIVPSGLPAGVEPMAISVSFEQAFPLSTIGP